MGSSPLQGNERVKTAFWQGRHIYYFADRLVIKFRPGRPDFAALVEDLCERYPQLEPVRKPSRGGRVVLSCPRETDIPSLCVEISSLEFVDWSEPDLVDTLAVQPNDPRFAAQWALPKTDATESWDFQKGAGVLIGIIDSGISLSTSGELNHPDLKDASRYILGTNFVDGNAEPRDENGHGTHVTGIAAADTNNEIGIAGMSWDSQVYVCKTFGAEGFGSAADFADAVEEIVDYAVMSQLNVVINYSAGSRSPSQAHREACKYIADHNMLLCAGAGNNNGSSIFYPAALSVDYPDAVLAIGATDLFDRVAPFSNVGPELTAVAPGVNILSTVPPYLDAAAYQLMSGTSMATPMATGLASLIWSSSSRPSSAEVRRRLVLSAHRLTACDFSNRWGYGRINGAPVAWGPSTQYETGKDVAIALRGDGNCVGLHGSSDGQLFYRVGRANFANKSVSWGDAVVYGQGGLQSVALDDTGLCVIVQQGLVNSLFYKVGIVDYSMGVIDFGGTNLYDSGSNPSIAMAVGGRCLEVHEGTGRFFYRVGRVDLSTKSIVWGPSTQFDTGQFISVALDSRGNCLEIHEGTGRLFYRVGRVNFNGQVVDWGPPTPFGNGQFVAVSLAENGRCLGVYENNGDLFYRIGTVDFTGKSVAWGPSTQYDTGQDLGVALDNNGNCLEAHVGSERLYYRTGISIFQ